MTAMRLPTLFLSHGSPMAALRSSPVAGPWAALARAVPRPQALLVVSAHWETELPMVGSAVRPPTLHDFGGFPPALERMRYPAPGAPEVADKALALLTASGLPASANGCRGLDHGAWVPLLHMYPQADVPVFQVSIQPSLGAAHHLRLGTALAPLASEGVLIVGSGSITHNLAEWGRVWGRVAHHERQTSEPESVAPYVRAFCDAVEAALRQSDVEWLAGYRERSAQAQRAHPTEEHFLPLLVAYAAAGTRPGVERIELGVDGGVIAMDVFVFTAAAA
jgi:4,5-DOPA dioxygenase extradiol